MAGTVATVDVLEQAASRREDGPELAEGVPLQRRDDAGKDERQPDGRPGNLAGGAEEREDPGAHHGADADERRLARADVASGCDVGRAVGTHSSPSQIVVR